MANTNTDTDRERFLNGFQNWAPVTPQPVPTREALRRELREHLIGKTGFETLVDVALDHLERQANERVRLEATLRQQLAAVDAAIEAFRRGTPKALAPHEARLKSAQDEFVAAGAALEGARSTRDSELARGLSARKNQILAELRGTSVPQGRMIGWRAGGAAPQFPPT
jgi:hypothetical protein